MSGLEGKVIKRVREMTPTEMAREGWDYPTTVIECTDGTLIYPSQDEEGNGPGSLFGFVSGKTVGFGV